MKSSSSLHSEQLQCNTKPLSMEDDTQTSNPSSEPYTADLESNSNSNSPTNSSNTIYGIEKRKVLSTSLVVALCYFNVSGGPIGTESIISAGGPLAGILTIFFFPLIWAIPSALITAELSTAYPTDGGYTIWVYHAFGPFWAFQEGYLSWISGVLDNSLYPALAVSAFSKGFFENLSPIMLYIVKAGLAIALTIPGLFGVKLVGTGMRIMTILVLIPFIVLSIWALLKRYHDWSVLGEVRRDQNGHIDIKWSTLINIVFWNFNGFDGMSVFAEEVADPSRTYPRALAYSVLLVTTSYLVPLISSTLFNEPHWSTWDEGSFTQISYALGGNGLTVFILISCLISNCSMFMTELFIDSFQLYGMAKQGLAPKIFAGRHPKYDTPIPSIMASLVIILGIVWYDFDVILDMTNAIYCLSMLLIAWGALKLRYSAKDVPRPYKVPGGNFVLLLLVIMMTILVCYVIVSAVSSVASMYIICGACSIGLVYGAIIKNQDQFKKTLVQAKM